jgi:hypothetical protein
MYIASDAVMWSNLDMEDIVVYTIGSSNTKQ